MFPVPHWICSMKKDVSSEGKKGDQPSSAKHTVSALASTGGWLKDNREL